MSGSESEKVSINVGLVDLGQIDLLVEQGFYSNRTDFLRTATRNLLATHSQTVQNQLTQRMMVIGVIAYNAKSLTQLREENKMVDIRVVGVASLSDDVSPELALATIKSLKVFGAFRASNKVKVALQSRIEV
jgi:Arc/MetJ-type ribon-helix-helix transcriptional regulator